MTGFQSKKTMAEARLAILESPSHSVNDLIRLEQLEQALDEPSDEVYEHEVVTTIRFKVRSTSPYLSKEAFLEEFAYLTDFRDLLKGDDYPRLVAWEVENDDVVYFDKEIGNE